MASPLIKPLHLATATTAVAVAATAATRLSLSGLGGFFVSFRSGPFENLSSSSCCSPSSEERPRIPGLGLGCRDKDGVGSLLRFPSVPRHHCRHSLPPLPLRLQVLPSPHRLRLLHQLRPHRPLTMAASDPLSSAIKTVRAEIKGRVQGVFYRNWTIENASQLGLNGWVRNRRDGSVEALFSGKPELVDEMEQRCRRGPPDAMVTSLQVFPCNDDPGTGFKRMPTV